MFRVDQVDRFRSVTAIFLHDFGRWKYDILSSGFCEPIYVHNKTNDMLVVGLYRAHQWRKPFFQTMTWLSVTWDSTNRKLTRTTSLQPNVSVWSRLGRNHNRSVTSWLDLHKCINALLRHSLKTGWSCTLMNSSTALRSLFNSAYLIPIVMGDFKLTFLH